MALDIHRLDTNEHIFGIEDGQYNCLKDIFEQFSRMTGVYIDQYGKTNLNIKYLVTDPATIYTKQLTMNIITVIMNEWKRQI
jgi:hypothetical protein